MKNIEKTKMFNEFVVVDNTEKESDPREIRFGLIAVAENHKGDIVMEDVLHFCGYWETPSDHDISALTEELATTEEFNLTDENIKVIEAPDHILSAYLDIIKGTNTDESL